MKGRKALGSKRSRGALRIWTLEERKRFPGKKFAGESLLSSLMANKEVEFHEAASEEFEAAFDDTVAVELYSVTQFDSSQ